MQSLVSRFSVEWITTVYWKVGFAILWSDGDFEEVFEGLIECFSK